MSEGLELELSGFEGVRAGGDVVLLRIAGRWRDERRERLSPPLLLLDDGRRTLRLAALPGPEDAAPLAGPDGPTWRAAYSAPAAAALDRATAFALEIGGEIVDLPHPVAHDVGLGPSRARATRGHRLRRAPRVDPTETEVALRETVRTERERRLRAEEQLAATREAIVELERRLQDARAAQRSGVEPPRPAPAPETPEPGPGRLEVALLLGSLGAAVVLLVELARVVF